MAPPPQRHGRWRAAAAVLVATAALLAAGAHPAAAAAEAEQPAPLGEMQVVLFGPYSNLARKYLWQALLQLWDAAAPGRLRVFAASNGAEDAGWAAIHDILERNVTCGVDADGAACASLKAAFLADVTYTSVRNASGYAALGAALAASTATPGWAVASRLVYMAVSPAVVVGVMESLTRDGGLDLGSSAGGFDTHVVLEKPIGSGATTARDLLYSVRRFVPESRILIADHYYGKVVVQAAISLGAIAPRVTLEWVKLFNNYAFATVVALEEETVAGRTGYYNGYGVVRDMMQNHMMVMTAAALAAPDKPWEAARRGVLDRLQLLDGTRMTPPRGQLPRHNRFGTYIGYAETVAAEAASAPTTANTTGMRDAAGVLRTDEFQRKYQRGPTPAETWGSGFVAPTAAQVAMAGPISPIMLVAAKAAGIKSTFMRLFWPMVQPAACGPFTVTYQVGGTFILPPGVTLPAGYTVPAGPAIVYTGVCHDFLPSPADLYNRSAGWAYDWDVASFPAHGLYVATPRLPPFRSARLHGAAPPPAPTPTPAPTATTGGGDDDEWVVSAEVDAAAAAAVAAGGARVSPRLLLHRFRQLGSLPGATSADAYAMLIAAGLAGNHDQFVTPHDVMDLWSRWEPMCDLGDMVGNSQLLARLPLPERDQLAALHTAYAVGDSSWLALMPVPRVQLAAVEAPGQLPVLPPPLSPAAAAAAPIVTSMVPSPAVLAASPGGVGGTWHLAAADVMQALWHGFNYAPLLHWALDGGRELAPMFDLIAAPDSAALGPWGGLNVWLTRERTTVATAAGSGAGLRAALEESCNVCAVLSLVTNKIRLAEAQIHPPLHPNISQLNIMADEFMTDGAMDLVSLRITNATVNAFTRARSAAPPPRKVPDVDDLLAAAGSSREDTLGSEERTFVSDGTSLREAIEWALRNPPKPTATPAPDANDYDDDGDGEGEEDGEELTAHDGGSSGVHAIEVGGDGSATPPPPPPADEPPPDMRPPGVPDHWRWPNMSAIPPPPPPYKGPLRVDLSLSAFRRARHVFVYIEASVFARIARMSPSPAAAAAAAAGVQADGSVSAVVAGGVLPSGDDAAGLASYLPPLLSDLIVNEMRGVRRAVRLYVVPDGPNADAEAAAAAAATAAREQRAKAGIRDPPPFADARAPPPPPSHLPKHEGAVVTPPPLVPPQGAAPDRNLPPHLAGVNGGHAGPVPPNLPPHLAAAGGRPEGGHPMPPPPHLAHAAAAAAAPGGVLHQPPPFAPPPPHGPGAAQQGPPHMPPHHGPGAPPHMPPHHGPGAPPQPPHMRQPPHGAAPPRHM